MATVANVMRLEISMESHPQRVLEVGVVATVPAVGDFVDCRLSNFVGYVKRRRWEILPDGKGINVRCWIHGDPP